MASLRRIGFFLLTNILVMMMLTVILSLTGLKMDEVGDLLVICAIFGFGGSLFSLLLSKSIVKTAYKVKRIKPANASSKELYVLDTIQKMAQYNKIKMPEVGIFPSDVPNAFATGATKNSALIAFSTGLINSLSEEEIAAVAGHEMTHILEGDMVTMSLLIGLVNTFVMFVARILAYALAAALRGKRSRGGFRPLGNMLLVMVIQNVLFLLAYIPISAYSRHREYRADAGAARLVNPKAMISALRALDITNQPVSPNAMATDMAMINNKRKVSLYATHPTIEDRVRALEKML